MVYVYCSCHQEIPIQELRTVTLVGCRHKVQVLVHISLGEIWCKPPLKPSFHVGRSLVIDFPKNYYKNSAPP